MKRCKLLKNAKVAKLKLGNWTAQKLRFQLFWHFNNTKLQNCYIQQFLLSLVTYGALTIVLHRELSALEQTLNTDVLLHGLCLKCHIHSAFHVWLSWVPLSVAVIHYTLDICNAIHRSNGSCNSMYSQQVMLTANTKQCIITPYVTQFTWRIWEYLFEYVKKSNSI